MCVYNIVVLNEHTIKVFNIPEPFLAMHGVLFGKQNIHRILRNVLFVKDYFYQTYTLHHV